MTRSPVGAFLGLVGILLAVFAVLFLGGLASAAWEIHREKRAGVPVTRPAWDRRDKRRAVGGGLASAKLWLHSKRYPMPTCWCGCGPIVYFPALDASSGIASVDGLGCAAWESGDQRAIRLHDQAGGYARTPLGHAA